MGGGAEEADHAAALELLAVVDVLAAKGEVVVLLRIDEVHHAQVDVVRVEAGQEVADVLVAELDVAGAQVLALLQDRADVPLQEDVLAAGAQRVAHVGADVGLGHEHVHDVDAGLHRRAHHGLGGGKVRVGHVLAAKADAADAQSRLSEVPVFHTLFPLAFFCFGAFSIRQIPRGVKARPQKRNAAQPSWLRRAARGSGINTACRSR